KARERLVEHADGWLPTSMGIDQVAAQWHALQDLAAERGRQQPIRTVLRANARYAAKAQEGADRAHFHGSVDQIVEDLFPYVELGMQEILVDLQSTLRDAGELKDVAAELYEKARAAGL
ncbi:LLM class flavin-dependent oxidoreductase, partial [Streptomyces sp. SID625]|nr:LLM class flavin-dependent oxidoreductase [Streptomyces sp. SID625]